MKRTTQHRTKWIKEHLTRRLARIRRLPPPIQTEPTKSITGFNSCNISFDTLLWFFSGGEKSVANQHWHFCRSFPLKSLTERGNDLSAGITQCIIIYLRNMSLIFLGGIEFHISSLTALPSLFQLYFTVERSSP